MTAYRTKPDVTETDAVPVRTSRTESLTRSYLLGLGLIAALGVAALLVTIARADGDKSSAQRMNLSGRQRLLTQRLVSAAYSVASHRLAQTITDTAVMHTLSTAADAWRTGYENIRNGSPALRLAAPDARDVALLDSVNGQRQRIEHLRTTISVPGLSAIATVPFVDSLAVTADEIVNRLDHYTAVLVARHHADVATTQRIGAGFCALLLCLLALEAQFVFRPATRAIGELLRDQDAVKTELYAKAEEMYNNSVEQEIQNDTLQSHQRRLIDQQEELLAQQTTLIEQRDHLELRTNDLSRLTAILDATPDAVAVFSLTGEVLYTNSAAEQHLQQVRRRDWTHAAHLLTAESVRQLRDVGFPRAIRRGVWQGESSLRSRGGPARTVVHTLLAHRGADGRVATISVMLQDITEQKALQAQLAEDEERTRSIIEALAEGVVVQDSEGNIIQWNAGAERILGLTGDQLSGRTSMDPAWFSVDPLGDPLPGDRHPISRARSEGISIDGEIMGVHRGDGTQAWLSVNARPMSNGGQRGQAAAVATFTDITETLAAARELETLSVVARQSDHAIMMLDRAGSVTWVNAAWENLAGYALADVAGQRPGEFLHGTHTRPESIAGIGTALQSGDRWSGDILNYRRDGSPYWIELTITPTLGVHGACTGFVGLARNITARRNDERERQQLVAAVSVATDGIAVTGVSGALEFVNTAFARMHGYKPAELLQTSWASLYESAEARRLVREAIPEVTQIGFWHGEATGRTREGTLYPEDLSLTLLPHGGLVAVSRDISERKAAEERLLHLSVRDELTSLYNRRGFLEQAESALKLATRQNVPCALLYGDLDSFKSVNDGFGHDSGDTALKTIAGILSASFRDTDLVARLGGDEFTILGIDLRASDIATIIERIDDAVTRSNVARAPDPAHAWHLGISLGVSYFDPQAPMDVEALLRVADSAQYETKRARKALVAATAPAARA